MSTLEKLPASLGEYGNLRIDPGCVLPLPGVENGFWVRLVTDNGSVEGKLHLPAVETTNLFIFEPGFPGGSSTDFETHHLKSFLANDWAVFTARHNGSFLNGQHASYYISCSKRSDKARLENQEFLGEEKQYSIADWLTEPITAVEALSSAFENIVIAGHSYGAHAIFHSLKELCQRKAPELAKIKRLISLAGATGRVRSKEDAIFVQLWAEYLDTDWARERLSIGEPEDNLDHLYNSYRSIHDWKTAVPPHIELIFATPWGDTLDSIDEVVSPQEALDMIVTLGRGALIVDKTQKAGADTGIMVHDMADLKTEMLLKFADLNWVPGKQIMCLDATGLS